MAKQYTFNADDPLIVKSNLERFKYRMDTVISEKVPDTSDLTKRLTALEADNTTNKQKIANLASQISELTADYNAAVQILKEVVG